MQDTVSKYFHQTTCAKVVSADKMMGHARGPVWQRKDQTPGIIPKGLRGLDTAGTWSYRKSDGWVYGHGTCCLAACTNRMRGTFKGMRNCGNEAKRLWLETGQLQGLLTTVLMDSPAADTDLFREFHRQR